MSESERLEERLRAFGAGPDGAADWEDVLQRSAGRLWARLSWGQLTLALATVVVVAASVTGVLVTRGTRPAVTGCSSALLWSCPGPSGPTGTGGATGSNGPTGTGDGPSGTVGPTGHEGPTGATTTAFGPDAMSASRLMTEALALGTPLYWAGPGDGDSYELTRTANGSLYLRYLPHGVLVGTPGKRFLIVATYPRPGAFAALKKQAGGKTVSGPDGSIIYVNPNDPRSVLLAFPNVDEEIEIYDPSSGNALAIAKSGDIRPVG